MLIEAPVETVVKFWRKFFVFYSSCTGLTQDR